VGTADELRARRNLRPRVAARSKWARIEALQRNRAFLVDYAAARAGWHEGATVLFPMGTYWLRRFANVPIAAVWLRAADGRLELHDHQQHAHRAAHHAGGLMAPSMRGLVGARQASSCLDPVRS